MSDVLNAAASGEFWDFTLAVYKHEGVAPACLSLQDRSGLDVNFLLLCVYAGSRGVALSDGDFTRIDNAVAAWRHNVIQPLRAVRRWLKGQAMLSKEAVDGLRLGVLAREIDSESHQQRLMERSLAASTGAPDPAIMAGNLIGYLAWNGAASDDETLERLGKVLSGATTDLGDEEAMKMLYSSLRRHGDTCPGGRTGD
jgi:uncharacterized protein (TIGR02444 family)